MEEKTTNLLEGAIRAQFENLSDLQPGSKDKAAAINELTALYRLKIEETKNELEFNERCQKGVMELELRMQEEQLKRKQLKEQLEEQVRDRYFRLGIAAAEIRLPLIFYAVWMHEGFKFERTGTYVSPTFRGLYSRFRPTKR